MCYGYLRVGFKVGVYGCWGCWISFLKGLGLGLVLESGLVLSF